MSKKSVKHSCAIVTGGANGIGFELCRRLLFKGAKAVVVLDIDASKAAQSIDKLNAEFGQSRAFFIQADVSKFNQFEETFKMAIGLLGGNLDILINNAAIVDEPNWSLQIDVNVKGVVQGTLLAIDVMGRHKGGNGGTIVNIGSTSSFVPFKPIPIYCGTKAAVVSFTRSMALSYEKTGVAMKAICPGAVSTELLSTGADRYLDFVNYDDALKTMFRYTPESPEFMAAEIVRLIEKTPNGTVWINAKTPSKHLIGTIKNLEVEDLENILIPI